MLSGKMIAGLKVVKQFFPEANVSDHNAAYKGVRTALEELGGMEGATSRDVVRVFDSHSIGVWGGTEIR